VNATIQEEIASRSMSNIENEDAVVKIDGKTMPFYYDHLGRKTFAETLMEKFKTLQNGKVIAIDAKWGEGKTWFGKNFQALLDEKYFRTCWIDTFENDHFDDPFLLISAEIYKLIKDNSQDANKEFPTQFMDALKPLAKPLGVAGEVLVNTAFKHLTGTSDATEKITEAFAKQSGEWIETQIKNYGEKDKSLTAFKKVLKEFCALEKSKPIIIFVDELDRCKPTFALAFLERLKHYFDIPNLVFVLLLNQKSLCATVKKTYGQEVDADEYLQKFISITTSFPVKFDSHPDRSDKSEIIRHLVGVYFEESNAAERNMIISTLEEFCQNPYITISNRDIHKILSRIWLLNLSQDKATESIKNVWIFLSVLQISNRGSFLNLKEGKEDLILKKMELFYSQSEFGRFEWHGKLLNILSCEEDLDPDTFRRVFYGNWIGANSSYRRESWRGFKKQLFNKVESLMG
jgi:hypothetical protein